MLESPRGRTRAAAVFFAASVALGGAAGATSFAGSAFAAAGDPTIKSLSVSKGSAGGGTNVLITGTGFSTVDEQTATNVVFGSTNATSFIVLSDTQIAAKAPAGTGAVSVKVTNGTGSTADTNADNFTYIDPITVTVPSGTLLSAAGGTTFIGTLTTGTLTTAGDITTKKITATVNGAAAKVAFSAADKLAITAPAGTPTLTSGKVTISVLSDGVTGTVDNTNAKYAAVVTKLSVTSGPTAGTNGTSDKPAVTITGVGLKGATDIKFGATTATCVAGSGTKEDTTLTCTNIPGGSAGPVTVVFTPAGGATFGITSGSTYTYTDVG
ncbi:IPT/TIG domain-containing protein [Cryptosporangium arvum]|uniref:IPT/TIG domain-containing protein n=1 Tax=Cryptosporangium arvum TaxID=80871 RepID=UPI0004AC8A91|nr:IPT/TIG domain-containing protein [Cryptosporangium arvum]